MAVLTKSFSLAFKVDKSKTEAFLHTSGDRKLQKKMRKDAELLKRQIKNTKD